MKTAMHTRTMFFMNAGLVALITSASNAAVTDPGHTGLDSEDQRDDTHEIADPLSAPNSDDFPGIGYIDIPDIDRGTGNNGPGGGDGPQGATAPSGGFPPGQIGGNDPEDLFRPFDVPNDSLEDILGATASDYYTEPVLELDPQEKSDSVFPGGSGTSGAATPAVPAPGTLPIGLLAGSAMIRRRRR